MNEGNVVPKARGGNPLFNLNNNNKSDKKDSKNRPEVTLEYEESGKGGCCTGEKCLIF